MPRRRVGGLHLLVQRGADLAAGIELVDGLFVFVEIRARDQVLMHADRAVHFAATAEQIAEREMRAHIGFVADMVLAGPLGTTTDEVGL